MGMRLYTSRATEPGYDITMSGNTVLALIIRTLKNNCFFSRLALIRTSQKLNYRRSSKIRMVFAVNRNGPFCNSF